MSTTGPSTTSDITSNFHTALEACNLSSLEEVALGESSSAVSSMEPKYDYFSACAEEMMRSRSHFSSAVEIGIQHSRVNWSEVTGLSDSSKDNDYEEVDVTSNFYSAYSFSLDEVALGDSSGAGSSMESKSEYFSARVEEMMRSKSQFSSAVEHEIEHSRVHWSEVSGLSNSSQDNNDYEEVDRENEEVFAELMNNPRWKHYEWGEFFIKRPPFWKLGRKIAEGGQAEIFELRGSNGTVISKMLLKVFKRGSRLSDLREQWPSGILRREHMCVVLSGLMLEDGRFAFVMMKCWGDLRKLIDEAMQEKNNQGPPFPYIMRNGTVQHVKDIMRKIAHHMYLLHKEGIIHRDLKAANILFYIRDDYGLGIIVADFECSIGVLGTGFWRAPEILLALKSGSAIDFSEKVDVYSYGMTCFEIVTGRLPFEGELEACRASNDLVIEGWRPKLPSDLDVTLKDLIERCWNPIPNERPSFSEIIEVLDS